MAFSLGIKHEADLRLYTIPDRLHFSISTSHVPQVYNEGQPVDIYPNWYPAGRAYFFQKQFPGEPRATAKEMATASLSTLKARLTREGPFKYFLLLQLLLMEDS